MPLPTRPFALGALILAAFALAACVKQVEQKPEAAPAPAPEPFSTAATVAPAQPTSVAGIPAAAIAAAERYFDVVVAASTATLDNGALYKQAQALFAEKKYAEALSALDAIQAELMTPAQTKAVDALRAQITAAQKTTP